MHDALTLVCILMGFYTLLLYVLAFYNVEFSLFGGKF